MKLLVALMLALTALATLPAMAQDSNLFYGGGIGMSFGTIDYIEVAPMIGIHATDRFSTGINLLYRYRNDSRYHPSISTNDYGGSVFARYMVFQNLYAHTEYEYLNFEYYDFEGKTSDSYTSFFLGGGVSQPIGSNVAFNATVLYNFSYSETDIFRPYDSPWVVRIGVAAGF